MTLVEKIGTNWNTIATLLPVSKKTNTFNETLLCWNTLYYLLIIIIRYGLCITLKVVLPASQGRTEQECRYRYTCVLDPNLIKGAWTKEEDERVSSVLRSTLQLCLEMKCRFGFKVQ